MLLGCCYNIFDGIELLEFSIKSIRSSVQYVVVVYQTISNFGEPSQPILLDNINHLKEIGLINEIIQYTPIGKTGHFNELEKRNIGLKACKKAGMSHFMSMDVDEMYLSEQLEQAKIEVEGYDSSACKMITYYKYPNLILVPNEEYFVSLIYKLDDRIFDKNNKWPILVDPTRKLTLGKLKIFERNIIEMHHFSYVRKNIRAKLRNSSANTNFINRIEEIAKWHDDWIPGKQGMLAGKEQRMYNLKEVENKFNINIS